MRPLPSSLGLSEEKAYDLTRSLSIMWNRLKELGPKSRWGTGLTPGKGETSEDPSDVSELYTTVTVTRTRGGKGLTIPRWR
jgi:hypothetical protein